MNKNLEEHLYYKEHIKSILTSSIELSSKSSNLELLIECFKLSNLIRHKLLKDE